MLMQRRRKYRRLPGKVLRGGELEARIIRVLAHEGGLVLYKRDIFDSEARLEEGMGVWLGSRGAMLYAGILNLIKKGKLVPYRCECANEVAYLYWKDWARAIEDYPEVEGQRVSL